MGAGHQAKTCSNSLVVQVPSDTTVIFGSKGHERYTENKLSLNISQCMRSHIVRYEKSAIGLPSCRRIGQRERILCATPPTRTDTFTPLNGRRRPGEKCRASPFLGALVSTAALIP